MLPDAPKGEKLKALLPRPDFVAAERLLDPTFRQLRAEADAWHAERTDFMTKRMEAGRHPDTDSSFWEGYTARPAPGLPTKSVPDTYNAWQERRLLIAWLVVIGVPVLLAGSVVGWWIVRSSRAKSA
ncbi:hypothetical protein BH23PLA1_BH23PLA1_20890 [soil metagenome]